MKIEFDKALLWILPYLYVVSVAYYWGYWGAFDIDIFNYYPVSDLIKGVTAPLGSSLLLVTGFGFTLALLKNQSGGAVSSRTSLIITIVGTLIMAAVLAFFRKEHHGIHQFDVIRNKANTAAIIRVPTMVIISEVLLLTAPPD